MNSAAANEGPFVAQVGVDAEARVIVATGVTQCAADNGELIPITKSAQKNTKSRAERVLADSEYKSEENFETLEAMEIDAHVALGRGEDDPIAANNAGPATARMHRKRRTKRGRKIYKRRRAIVEPVFGWVKSVLCFQAYSMRGLPNVEGEWDLVCSGFNVMWLFRAQTV